MKKIKEFVKSEKKKKLLEMMNQSDMNTIDSPSPFAQNPFAPNLSPMTDAIPNNPFKPMMQKQVSDTQPSDEFNVDELVRKIDAKIAELEEEERRNKKEEEEKKKNANVEIIGDKDSEMLHQNSVIDKNLELDDDDDDDEFFDDFFDN